MTTRLTLDQILAIATACPSDCAVNDKFVSDHVETGVRYTVGNFSRLYQQPTPASGPQLTIPDGVKTDDIISVLRLQAEIDTHLSITCLSLANLVGRRVQLGVDQFLQEIEPTLRQAFELENVESDVRKRARGLFESKADRQKRSKLAAESASLSEVQ